MVRDLRFFRDWIRKVAPKVANFHEHDDHDGHQHAKEPKHQSHSSAASSSSSAAPAPAADDDDTEFVFHDTEPQQYVIFLQHLLVRYVLLRDC